MSRHSLFKFFKERKGVNNSFSIVTLFFWHKDSQLSSWGSTQLSSPKHRQKVVQKIVQKLSKKSFKILSKTVRACLSWKTKIKLDLAWVKWPTVYCFQILEATLALQGGSELKNAPVENISPHCEMLQKDFNLTVFQAYTRPRSRQSNFSRREEMSTSVFQSETIEKERGILWWNCQKISSSSLSILVWKEFNILGVNIVGCTFYNCKGHDWCEICTFIITKTNLL